MKLYELGPLEEGEEYFPTRRKAIARAKSYGEPGMYVDEVDIGRLTKDVACRLASGRGFVQLRRRVWSA